MHGNSAQWATLPALRRVSASPLANDRTAGTVGTVLSETVATVSLSAPPAVACGEQLAHSRTAGIERSDLEAATSTCFRFTTLALTPTDIRNRHRHRGGMSGTSKNTATDRVANSCHRNNTNSSATVPNCLGAEVSWVRSVCQPLPQQTATGIIPFSQLLYVDQERPSSSKAVYSYQLTMMCKTTVGSSTFRFTSVFVNVVV